MFGADQRRATITATANKIMIIHLDFKEIPFRIEHMAILLSFCLLLLCRFKISVSILG
jgi:hypothetical protein